ncbi:protein sneaky-like [Teleopsis dalmanni]|uniref:protein sneaky-like n=1 Tax=Teleopsis dalmanni TaxID=139649 RepID=UPI0018CEAA73|nr:protein sneaky-like [Teleopsis dalmanni]
MSYGCCRSFCRKCCVPCYCILWGRDEKTWLCTRYISGFLIALLISTVFWYYTIANLCVSWELNFVLLAVCITFTVFGFIFNKGIRCILFLLVISIFGSSGRTYLRALCFATVLSGPIENLSLNGGEIVRVYTCANILTYNLTKTRLDLITKPFQRVLYNIREDAAEINKTFGEVREFMYPVHNEIESDDETWVPNENDTYKPIEIPENTSKAEFIQDRYTNKFRKRCYHQMGKSKDRCQVAFREALLKCEEKIPFLVRTLLCWPFKVDFVCNINIFSSLETVCDPTDAIPRDFGKNYVVLNETENELFNNSKMEVNYTIHYNEIPPGFNTADEMGEKIYKEYTRKKQIFSTIIAVQEKLLLYFFIVLVIGSIKYRKKFLNDIDSDNIYINDYFLHIDERRRKLGKRTILPLKKRERNKLVDTNNICNRTKEEKKSAKYHILRLSVEIIIGLFFILLDYIIVVLLKIVRMESETTYTQEGEHTITFSIEGTGLMARLLQKTMRNFNIHERVRTQLSNKECLPLPNQLDDSFYMKMGILYSSIIILTSKSTAILRLRHMICAYFYRKREKQRTLYLYNSLLRERRNQFKKMLREAQNNAAKNELRNKLNIFLKLRAAYPNSFKFLKNCQYARFKCLICEEREDDLFVFCPNTKCNVTYCRDCWEDMPDFCLLCRERIKETKINNFDQFFEEVNMYDMFYEPYVLGTDKSEPETDKDEKEKGKNVGIVSKIKNLCRKSQKKSKDDKIDKKDKVNTSPENKKSGKKKKVDSKSKDNKTDEKNKPNTINKGDKTLFAKSRIDPILKDDRTEKQSKVDPSPKLEDKKYKTETVKDTQQKTVGKSALSTFKVDKQNYSSIYDADDEYDDTDTESDFG